jgi:CBS domain containing-hemolysin-like protein
VDEFGGTEGLITMEDIIEEIVGDILDEYDEVRNPFEKKNDGSTLIDAAMSIAEFNAHFPKSIPEDSDYETLAGYLQKITGRLPEIKEEIRTTEYMFTILTKSARRLRQIKVSRLF